LRALYRHEYLPVPAADLLEEEELSSDEADMTVALLTGVLSHRDELDNIINRRAVGWGTDRLSIVDLNLLRLALYELLHTDTPAEVVIDEAVELAKSYGTDNAPSFINGILDRTWKDGLNQNAK